ncbi:PepSY domain-containing protein [Bradyrhizobium sp. ORS 111]|uniref:PepSY domain-containing protein n=1 Tax=Bradyrhizobium sp. ORS 111 TaxID=1685958 RepID=UPI00388F8D66
MQTRRLAHLLLALAIAGAAAPASALTQDELVAKLKAAGYADVTDIKSTAEGTTARATKNGKEVRLVIDSSGQVKERN